MHPSSNTHKHTYCFQLIFLPLQLALPSTSLFSSLVFPLSSLLPSPHSLFALLLLCHFSCLPFPPSPQSLPPSSANPLNHLPCRHPCPAHVPALLISPNPRSSSPCLPLRTMCHCSCEPSPIINHFDCDTDHFCLSPFISP